MSDELYITQEDYNQRIKELKISLNQGFIDFLMRTVEADRLFRPTSLQKDITEKIRELNTEIHRLMGDI